MQNPEVYDVIVIGAGIMGSSSAYEASKQSKKVLLMEQYDLLHSNGSSHGKSRIFRVAYPTKHHTELCLKAYDIWKEIEKTSGENLLKFTGGLDFGHENNKLLQDLRSTLSMMDIDYELYDPEETLRRFNIKLPDDHISIYTKDAGIVNATKAVKTIQTLAIENGVKIESQCKVSDIEEIDSEIIKIKTEKSEFYGKKIIVTAGAWSKEILESSTMGKAINFTIPLNPIQTFVAYWKCLQPSIYDSSNFPVFINYQEPHVYGFPVEEYASLMKVCYHSGPSVNPNDQICTMPNNILTRLKRFCNSSLVDVSSTPEIIESCMYTLTPDHDFILDFLPGSNQRVIVGAGFSGHGFKMGPMIGKLLSQMALNELSKEIPESIEAFSLSRFER